VCRAVGGCGGRQKHERRSESEHEQNQVSHPPLVVRGPPARYIAWPGVRECRILLGVTSGTSLLRRGEKYKGPGGEPNAGALPTTRPIPEPRCPGPAALETVPDVSGR
jgi:hypothetical protein